MNNNVCAVVVTFNRKYLLIDCLEALQRQTRPIQGIYLIDNASTDGTPELLLEKNYINELPPKKLDQPWEKEFEIKNFFNKNTIKLHYVRMHENLGGAGGFYEGVKRGYEKGYDWLWLMDDDAEPKEDALEILSNYFKSREIVGLAGTVMLPDNKISIFHRGRINMKINFPLLQSPLNLEEYKKDFVEIDIVSFVGLLVKREAIEKVGFPKKEFFIHHDDVEYCLRLRKVGKIFLIPKSIIFHKEDSKKAGIKKRFLGKELLRTEFDRLWLTYYSRRNIVWLSRQYSKNKTLLYIKMLMRLLKSIMSIILFDDHKFKRIKFILNAYIDGLKGNFDNKKPKNILYGQKN